MPRCASNHATGSLLFLPVNQRAKLSRVEWKTALKSIHSEMINYRHFAGELWSDRDGYNCRNQKATFCQQRVSKESISSITRSLKLSRTTVRKHLKTEAEPTYQRQIQLSPKFGKYKELLESWLKAEAQLPRNQRRTAKRLYDGLVAEGYTGAYDSVQRFVKQWKAVESRKQGYANT